MLHVVTVHWQSEAWIEPQLRYLARNAPPSTRVWASLDGVEKSHRQRFHFATSLEGTHPEKLNALAAIVAESASRDDHLLFLDGDAFPVTSLAPLLADPSPLTAVRRDENLGDPQPHPCFCLTTVGFWQDVAGDWTEGYQWASAGGEMVSDVGANLLGILRDRGVAWRPLLRTNLVDLHPLWFGVYGDPAFGHVAYHHGAGFRERLARLDIMSLGLNPGRAAARSRVPSWVPLLGRAERRFRRRRALSRRARWEREKASPQEELASEVYASILEDDSFYARFTG